MRTFTYTGKEAALYVRNPETRENTLFRKNQPVAVESASFQRELAEHPEIEEVKAEAKPEKAPSRKHGES